MLSLRFNKAIGSVNPTLTHGISAVRLLATTCTKSRNSGDVLNERPSTSRLGSILQTIFTVICLKTQYRVFCSEISWSSIFLDSFRVLMTRMDTHTIGNTIGNTPSDMTFTSCWHLYARYLSVLQLGCGDAEGQPTAINKKEPPTWN